MHKRQGRETVDEWIERIGYCLHTPTCAESAACRLKRALERLPKKARPYTGQTLKPRKLDFSDE